MNTNPDSPVYDKNVLELFTVANDYCLSMKTIEKTPTAKLIDYLRKVCPLLYLKASLLPDVEVSNPDANERYVTEEEWEALFNQLRNKFGKDDEFWFVDADTKKDLVKGSLAEHLTDIYQDLLDFFILYQKNSLAAKENAVFEINRLFNYRWGASLVRVQNILHHLAVKPTLDNSDYNEPPYFDLN